MQDEIDQSLDARARGEARAMAALLAEAGAARAGRNGRAGWDGRLEGELRRAMRAETRSRLGQRAGWGLAAGLALALMGSWWFWSLRGHGPAVVNEASAVEQGGVRVVVRPRGDDARSTGVLPPVVDDAEAWATGGDGALEGALAGEPPESTGQLGGGVAMEWAEAGAGLRWAQGAGAEVGFGEGAVERGGAAVGEVGLGEGAVAQSGGGFGEGVWEGDGEPRLMASGMPPGTVGGGQRADADAKELAGGLPLIGLPGRGAAGAAGGGGGGRREGGGDGVASAGDGWQLASQFPQRGLELVVRRDGWARWLAAKRAGQRVPVVPVADWLNAFPVAWRGQISRQPVQIRTELQVCPWQPQHRLLWVLVEARPVPGGVDGTAAGKIRAVRAELEVNPAVVSAFREVGEPGAGVLAGVLAGGAGSEAGGMARSGGVRAVELVPGESIALLVELMPAATAAGQKSWRYPLAEADSWDAEAAEWGQVRVAWQDSPAGAGTVAAVVQPAEKGVPSAEFCFAAGLAAWAQSVASGTEPDAAARKAVAAWLEAGVEPQTRANPRDPRTQLLDVVRGTGDGAAAPGS